MPTAGCWATSRRTRSCGSSWAGVLQRRDAPPTAATSGSTHRWIPRIRNLECENTGYADIRRHQGARQVRLTQLTEEHKGGIDVEIGQEILADHYDVYLRRTTILDPARWTDTTSWTPVST